MPLKAVNMPTDPLDENLLALLIANARLGHAELARRLRVSRTTVQARIESLERRGVIAGYTLRLTDRARAARLHAQVSIVVTPKAAAGVVAALRGDMAVRELHSVSGAFDLLAMIEAPDITALDAAIDRIGALEGVERTQSSIILSTKFER